MVALYGLLFNVLWIIALVKIIKLDNRIDELKKSKKLLEEKCTHLERSVRDEANKNIILESLLKQRPNQNEERKLY